MCSVDDFIVVVGDCRDLNVTKRFYGSCISCELSVNVLLTYSLSYRDGNSHTRDLNDVVNFPVTVHGVTTKKELPVLVWLPLNFVYKHVFTSVVVVNVLLVFPLLWVHR